MEPAPRRDRLDLEEVTGSGRSLQSKDRTFVEDHHRAVPFRELEPSRSKRLSAQTSLNDNLIVEVQPADISIDLPDREKLSLEIDGGFDVDRLEAIR